MAFDYKKVFKEYYMPKSKPEIIEIPQMNYIAIRGKGNPNIDNGEYQQAVAVLYAISYTLKMSYKGNYNIDGYFEYVVPPLEGFWWQDGINGVNYANKDEFNWISVIRLPDFVRKEDYEWAKKEAQLKKKIDCDKAEFLSIDEGLCVQIMHIGSYDTEPISVGMMDEYIKERGYENDINNNRLHHEIYLSDPRKTDISKLRTVIRHPIKIMD